MIVLKFGGTSVGSAAMMQRTLDVVAAELERAPVLVASAMSGVTDKLLRLCRHAAAGQPEAAFTDLGAIGASHLAVVREALVQELTAGEAAVNGLIKELEGLIRGLCMIREVSARSQDAVLSFGERLSTRVLYHLARERGLSVDLLDARDFIRTDEDFGSASLQRTATYHLVAEQVRPRSRHLVITQGFIAATEKGVTTTLGRGGSDWSATIIGAALRATEVQIWTDVDGIMTTDPRIVPGARVLDRISYEEAAELAFFGAKVIHPSTIQPAVELGIPVWVRNTMNPAAPGTAIVDAAASVGGRTAADTVGTAAGKLKAIAGKKNVNLITVRSNRMLNAHGFLRAIFQVFESHQVSVDLIATSEVSVSMTIDDPGHLRSIRRELEAFSEVSVEESQAILCLVGQGLWRDSGFIARVFTALGEIPVRLVTLGSSEINLSLVVDQAALEPAITALHHHLFGS